MFFPIIILLAFCGPLFIGRAYQTGRAWGALVGASSLLLSLFLAGMNFATAWNLAITHPFYSLVVFGAVSLGFFFAGPGSALWRWAGRVGPVRLIAFRLRRRFYRQGYSRQWTGNVAAMALALLILAPVSFLTLKPDPSYQYALNKLQREIAAKLPEPNATVQAAIEALVEPYLTGTPAGDGDALAAAERRIMDAAKSTQAEVSAVRASPERLSAPRAQIDAIASRAVQTMHAEAPRVSRHAMSEAARRLLDSERTALVEATRRAMIDTVAAGTPRARETIVGMEVHSLRETTHRLIESMLGDAASAGRTTAADAAKRVVEDKHAMVGDAGRDAWREFTEATAIRAAAELKRVLDELKQAIAAGDDGIMTPEKRRRQELIEARDRENRQAGFVPNEYVGKRALLDFSVSERTKYSGWLAAPELAADSLGECAYYCLRIQCFFFTYYSGSPKSCRRLMSPVQIEGGGELNTSARRK